MSKFNPYYFTIAAILFVIEVLIAVYIQDEIIRPFIGDLLVVILIYCSVKAFLNTKLYPTVLFVLVFSYVIEILQYFNFVRLIGLADSKLANIIIGNYFAWMDILMYTLGILIVIIIENIKFRKYTKSTINLNH